MFDATSREDTKLTVEEVLDRKVTLVEKKIETMKTMQDQNHTVNAILDSSATTCGTSDEKILTNIEAIPARNVMLVDDNTFQAKAKGTIHCSVKYDESTQPIIFKNVLYYPKLRGTIISVSSLCDGGASVLFTKYGCVVYQHDENGKSWVIMKGRHVGNLYKLKLIKSESINVTKDQLVQSELLLLHFKLGHVGMSKLKIAMHDGRLKGVSDAVIKAALCRCDICRLGKMRVKKVAKKAKYPTIEIGQCIHSDESGNVIVQTPGSKKCFSVMIDEKSRFTLAKLLRRKPEVQQHFKDFGNLISTQHNKRVQMLRCDNASEFVKDKKFRQYLADKGVKIRTYTPYKHSLNGLAERTILKLTDIANCLLIQSRLTKRFWGEAIMYAEVILNMTPTKSLDGKTPYEMWEGVIPDVDFLKPFGCLCYVLEPRAVKCVVIGFTKDRKAYRAMQIDNGKIHHSIDIEFEEMVFPFKDEQDEQESSQLISQEDINNETPTMSESIEGFSNSGKKYGVVKIIPKVTVKEAEKVEAKERSALDRTVSKTTVTEITKTMNEAKSPKKRKKKKQSKLGD